MVEIFKEGLIQSLRGKKAELIVQGRRDGKIAPGGEVLDENLKKLLDNIQAQIDLLEK